MIIVLSKKPHRYGNNDKQKKVTTVYTIVTFVVEMTGVEPVSENCLPRVSTSVVAVLNLPYRSAQRQALRLCSS